MSMPVRTSYRARPQVSRIWGIRAGLVVVALVVGGCATANAETPAPAASARTAPAIRAPRREEPADTAAIRAVHGYWAARAEVMAHVGTWDEATARTALARVAAGAALGDELIDFRMHQLDGIGSRGTIVSHPTVTGTARGVVPVRDCVDTQIEEFFLDDGTRADVDDPALHPFLVDVARSGDGYRVVRVQQVWTDCVLAPPATSR